MSNYRQYWVGCFRQLAYSILFLIYKIMETEIFKNIIWFEWLYQISNKGNVKSLERKVKWWHNNLRIEKEKLLKPYNAKWYLYIELSNEWIRKKYLIHRLVANAFIPNPENKKEVNHIDWNKLNNNIENLEWNTQSENRKHCVDILNKNCKIVIQYDLLWKEINKYNWCANASRKTWISKSWICGVCNWKNKTSWGFIWKYV